MKYLSPLAILCAALSPAWAQPRVSDQALARMAPGAKSPTLVTCPKTVISNEALRQARQFRLEGRVHEGETILLSHISLDHGKRCVLQVAPTVRALSADDPLVSLIETNSALGDGKSLTSVLAESKAASCENRAHEVSVYRGRCGSGGSFIGTAFFATPFLAVSGGSYWQSLTEACLVQDDSPYNFAFYDVHQIRKTSTGDATMAGLSLMRPAPSTTNFQAVYGPMTSNGASFGVTVEGKAGPMSLCLGGTVNQDYGTWVKMYAGETLGEPTLLAPGGPAYLNSLSAGGPYGFQMTSMVTPNGFYRLHYPLIKRFGSNDLTTLTQWSNTAAPSASQKIEIASPAANSVVNANLPLYVNVTSGNGFQLELNGQPVGNPINLWEGMHTLVAYQPSAPQFRHTIRFEARRIISPDTFEIDDTASQWKPLYDNTIKSHNFHKSNDADWSAFGVSNGARINIAMRGSAFGNCTLNLYLHPNYPNGTRQLVNAKSGSCASLDVTHVSPATPSSSVYFVEARLNGAVNGNSSDYSLNLETSRDPIAADAYESDDTQPDWKPLFSGQPQTHNFHQQGDADWNGFGVFPNAAVTVTVSGTGTAYTRVNFYRQAQYPDGPLELVDSAEGQEPLTVFDQHPTTDQFTVYFVETRATWPGYFGSASAYTISVDAE